VIKLSLKEAEGHLGRLIEEAAAGEEIVITGRSSTVRLLPLGVEDSESESPKPPEATIGHALDRFIGAWTHEEEAELLRAVQAFEHIDGSFWS
jgi:antitoxin (DNA-binding transcriptional repressor) of toxin-antitoxin stability system